MDVQVDISVDVAVDANLRASPFPNFTVDQDVGFEVDANNRRAVVLQGGTPPEPEGLTAGALDAWVQSAESATSGSSGGVGGATDGFQLPLGDIEAEGDGSWTPGAVPLDDSTPVSEAIDRLNEVLGLLVPAQPPPFPNGPLSISNLAGNSPRLAAGGVADNSGGGSAWAPGGSVARITAAGVSSFTFNDVGPGNSGTIEVFVNGVLGDTHTLTGTGDNGTYGALVLGDQKDFPPAQPGFWKSIDISVANEQVPAGINKFKVVHTAAGASNDAYFVSDPMTATPAVSAGSVAQAALGTLVYSSGVPHFGTGGQLTVGASMNNLAGETYYGGADPFTVSGTGGIFSNQTFGFAALGVSTPIARQTLGVTSLTPQTISIDGAVHGSGQVQGTAKNVNGSSGAVTLATTTILVKRGSAGSRIDENSVPVTGLGSTPNGSNAGRVGAAAGDHPAGAVTAWDPSAAIQAYDATVVAGVLKHDQTNYSVGYLPVGPDLSVGRGASQYVTFAFQRSALSAFKIAITGSYAGCWIKLPGVSDQAAISPNAPNGWWDAFQSYTGAGVPGNAADANAGCALGSTMNGGSGTFQMTFGTETSTHSAGNTILVRVKLNPGQSVTALSFSN